MHSRLVLLILSIAAGVAVAVSGLYFGTDLFERDPLAGMEAEPAIELAVAEPSSAGAKEVVAAGEADSLELAEAEAALSPAIGEPVEAVSRARTLEARSASRTDTPGVAARPATMAESTDGVQVEEARRERPKGWKTHYALLTFPASAETARPDVVGGHTASRVSRFELNEAEAIRRRGRLVPGDAAPRVDDPERAGLPTGSILGWKTHYALRELAQGTEEVEVTAASAEAGDHAPEMTPEQPESVRERAGAADPLPAEEAGRVEIALLQPETFLGWKTHYAVPAAVRDATDLEEMRVRQASIEAADPAPVPATIAIETVEFEEPDRVSVTGRAEPGARVRVYLEDEGTEQAASGSEILGAARGDESGVWQINGTRTLPPGRYRVRAEIRDAADRTIASAERRFDRVEVVMAEEPSPVSPAEDSLADRVAELPALGEAREAESAAGPTTVHIERGDNLWHIAEAVYGDGLRYHDIYAFNRNQISDPDLIYPGQIFTVPVLEDAD